MNQPTALGPVEVRTRDGQTFRGRAVAVWTWTGGYLVVHTRPCETARVGIDNIAEVIAR